MVSNAEKDDQQKFHFLKTQKDKKFSFSKVNQTDNGGREEVECLSSNQNQTFFSYCVHNFLFSVQICPLLSNLLV